MNIYIRTSQFKAWGWTGSDTSSTSAAKQGVFYLQWCKLSDKMFTQPKDKRNPLKQQQQQQQQPGAGAVGLGAGAGLSGSVSVEMEEKWLVVPSEIAFSSQCETMWVGSLSSLR